MAAPPPPQRPAREATVYECGDCGTRYLGQQRCADCGTFCRRIGPGGTCAACDEPVAISDLIATCRPGNIANRQSATPQENQ
jgi:hypothetical protein